VRHSIDGRIDLEHHLMPDPVGEALSVLIDRIEFLEVRLAHMQQRARTSAHTTCSDCDKETTP
jgi:serine O-acetyltransferase